MAMVEAERLREAQASLSAEHGKCLTAHSAATAAQERRVAELCSEVSQWWSVSGDGER